MDEPRILISDPDFRLHRFIVRHQRHQDRARLHHRAARMGRQALDDSVLRRLQFQKAVAMALLLVFLDQLVQFRLDLHAFRGELLPVVRRDLRHALPRLASLAKVASVESLKRPFSQT